jgi:large subunit ribosomal protein L36
MNILKRFASPLLINLPRIWQPPSSVGVRNSSLLASISGPSTGIAKFLAPVTPLIVPNCGFKQVGKLKKRCKGCYFVVRQERAYIQCRLKPRHRQMAMKKDEDKSWISSGSSATPFRPW